jgi:hypothetical protein
MPPGNAETNSRDRGGLVFTGHQLLYPRLVLADDLTRRIKLSLDQHNI